jgi:ketosteroid isomerase-like protein
MSEENVDNFRRGVEAWNRNDFDAWIDQFDPEVEWFTLLEEYRGHAGARKAWEGLKGTMQIRARFDDIRDLGESVLALGQMEGTGETTRLNFTDENAQLVTFRGGKVVTMRSFRSHAEALEAAGLSE